MIGTLVRAVSKDGTVWWVRPESRVFYGSLEHAACECTPEELAGEASYTKNYWSKK